MLIGDNNYHDVDCDDAWKRWWLRLIRSPCWRLELLATGDSTNTNTNTKDAKDWQCWWWYADDQNDDDVWLARVDTIVHDCCVEELLQWGFPCSNYFPPTKQLFPSLKSFKDVFAFVLRKGAGNKFQKSLVFYCQCSLIWFGMVKT